MQTHVIRQRFKSQITVGLKQNSSLQVFARVEPQNVDELLESSDITLFKAALKNPDHGIHPLLPPPKAPVYNLRKRSHGLLLPTTQSNLLRKNFVYCCYLKTFISYYMYYSLHVVEPLRYDSVRIKETNE